MINVSIHQELTIVLNIHGPNNVLLEYFKGQLVDIKGDIVNNTI